MSHIKFIIIIFIITLSGATRGDLPVAPYAKVSVSPNGRYFFLVIPDLSSGDPAIGRGVMYEATLDGALNKRWETKGWYSLNVYVSNDGIHLVRLTNPCFGDRPTQADVVLFFYAGDKLLRSYSVTELLSSASNIPKSISLYEWAVSEQGLYGRIAAEKFILKTVDGTVHQFDLMTGKELNKGP